MNEGIDWPDIFHKVLEIVDLALEHLALPLHTELRVLAILLLLLLLLSCSV